MRTLALRLAVGAMLLAGAAVAAERIARTDADAIQAIEWEWAAAWNRHDGSALAALCAEDVDFVTATGTLLKGRTQVRDHYALVLASESGTWSTDSVALAVLAPGVVLVHVNWRIVGRRGRSSRVVVKRDGRWTIRSSHEGYIVEN